MTVASLPPDFDVYVRQQMSARIDESPLAAFKTQSVEIERMAKSDAGIFSNSDFFLTVCGFRRGGYTAAMKLVVLKAWRARIAAQRRTYATMYRQACAEALESSGEQRSPNELMGDLSRGNYEAIRQRLTDNMSFLSFQIARIQDEMPVGIPEDLPGSAVSSGAL